MIHRGNPAGAGQAKVTYKSQTHRKMETESHGSLKTLVSLDLTSNSIGRRQPSRLPFWMFVINEMKVDITNTSLLNTRDYSSRVRLFAGPSVTSSKSRNEQFGFFFGVWGNSNVHKKLLNAYAWNGKVTVKVNQDVGGDKCHYFKHLSLSPLEV